MLVSIPIKKELKVLTLRGSIPRMRPTSDADVNLKKLAKCQKVRGPLRLVA